MANSNTVLGAAKTATADFLCKLLIEVNAGKVKRAIEEAALKCEEEDGYIVETEKLK